MAVLMSVALKGILLFSVRQSPCYENGGRTAHTSRGGQYNRSCGSQALVRVKVALVIIKPSQQVERRALPGESDVWVPLEMMLTALRTARGLKVLEHTAPLGDFQEATASVAPSTWAPLPLV